ncbi:RNA polymerase sigma-70 factor [Chitinophaga sp. SYP-B3965]|uniref:RNA polymerase sigma factor n=1 Tax=Chitinophaga sp. SYP-B3965 TaxID=2663120 RepID=UPI001299D827|nr:RNA polymerase sigma-70 factor [Chitinophaga sp. SYP-B3965]MRG47963.1 RNA polymerase sigma-70 factor [Chitinophaga sp. SYP-B3965]
MEYPFNEKDLLRHAAEGNSTAFATLFNNYKDKLYRFLVQANGSPELTEDIIQDVFLKLWKDRANLVNVQNFGGYLYRMAQNHVINSLKRMATETHIIQELSKKQEDTCSDVEEHISLQEVNRSLHSALNKLTPKQKLVYTLSRDKGLRHDEIARFLNISPSTVNNHLIEALRIIRRQLRTTPDSFTLLAYLFFLLS